MYIKTLLTKIMIENGKLLTKNQNPESDLIEMKIKIPAHVARCIVNCSYCFAKPGKFEVLFDLFCTAVFQKGIIGYTKKEFKDPTNHIKLIKDILKKNPRCYTCLKENANGIDIQTKGKSP